MSEKLNTCLRGWKAVGAGLTLLGAAALPLQAAAQQATDQVATVAPDSQVVIRGEDGKLRAPTGPELEAMHQAGKSKMVRAAPAATQQKFHANGARGSRLTDEFMSMSVVVRNAKGGLDMQCLEPGHSAQGVHSTVSHVNQPVEE